MTVYIFGHDRADGGGQLISPPPMARLERYLRDSQAVFDRGAALIESKGKWAMSWTGYGNEPEQLPPTNTSGDACSIMARWVAGVRDGHTFSPSTMAFSKCWRFPCRGTPPPVAGADAASTGLEPAAGDSWPNGPPTPADQNATVAAFMLARGASAVLQLHVHGVHAEGDTVIERPSPLNVLNDTYEHSCYHVRSGEYQHLMTVSPGARRLRRGCRL